MRSLFKDFAFWMSTLLFAQGFDQLKVVLLLCKEKKRNRVNILVIGKVRWNDALQVGGAWLREQRYAYNGILMFDKSCISITTIMAWTFGNINLVSCLDFWPYNSCFWVIILGRFSQYCVHMYVAWDINKAQVTSQIAIELTFFLLLNLFNIERGYKFSLKVWLYIFFCNRRHNPCLYAGCCCSGFVHHDSPKL